MLKLKLLLLVSVLSQVYVMTVTADNLGMASSEGMAEAVDTMSLAELYPDRHLSYIFGQLKARSGTDLTEEQVQEAVALLEQEHRKSEIQKQELAKFGLQDSKLMMWANIGNLSQHPSIADANWLGMKIPQYTWQGVKQLGLQVITDPVESAAWVAAALAAIWVEDELNGGGGSSPPPQQKTLKATVTSDGTTIEATGVDTAEGDAEFYDADGNLRVKTRFKTSTN